MNILAIESSCDETAVAIVRDGREVLTDCISSQVELHKLYGGVVPEIASRKHIEAIYGLADQALVFLHPGHVGVGKYGHAVRRPGSNLVEGAAETLGGLFGQAHDEVEVDACKTEFA